MNPQYEILAKCLLPTHMLEWFDLTNVEVKPKEKTVTSRIGQLPHQESANCHINNRPTATLKIGQLPH